MQWPGMQRQTCQQALGFIGRAKGQDGSEVGGCEDGDNKRAHESLPDVWLMALVLQILVLMTRKGLRQRGSALREDRHPLNL